MYKLFTLIILILVTPKFYSQNLEFCSPKFIENISNKIIKKLPSRDIKKIKNYKLNTEKDWLIEVDINLNNQRILNYEDFVPIIKYKNTINTIEFDQYQLERIITQYVFEKIRKKIPCLSSIIEDQIIIAKQKESELKYRIKKDTLDNEYIPKNLEDAIETIDSKLSNDLKSDIIHMTEDDFILESHFGIGLTMIRNGWSLWGKSRLFFFFEKKGINHPDDMSSIILTSYYRNLTGKPIRFDDQIIKIKDYHLKNSTPSKMTFPPYVKDVQWVRSIGYPEDENEEDWADVHFFYSLNKKIIWIYNYKYGWKRLTKKQHHQFERLYDTQISNWLENIYSSR